MDHPGTHCWVVERKDYARPWVWVVGRPLPRLDWSCNWWMGFHAAGDSLLGSDRRSGCSHSGGHDRRCAGEALRNSVRVKSANAEISVGRRMRQKSFRAAQPRQGRKPARDQQAPPQSDGPSMASRRKLLLPPGSIGEVTIGCLRWSHRQFGFEFELLSREEVHFGAEGLVAREHSLENQSTNFPRNLLAANSPAHLAQHGPIQTGPARCHRGTLSEATR